MKHINLAIRKILPLVVMLWALSFTFAQSVKMTASAPRTVGVNQQFQVTFSITIENSNTKPQNFKQPSFKGLNYIGGPFQSQGSSTSWINGKKSSSLNISYTYTLSASSEGTFKIDPATCTFEGRNVSSNPLTITADKSVSNQQQNRNSGGGGWSQQTQQTHSEPVSLNNNTLFIRAIPNKTSVYQGEEVLITYRIYSQVQLRQFQIDKLPSNKGFWCEDLTDNNSQQIQQREEVINGKRYSTFDIRKIALFPQEIGTLKLSPINTEVSAIVQTQTNRRRSRSIFDDFFDDPFFGGGASYQVVNKDLKSNTININVKALPNEPANFSGAVGNFSVKSSVDTKKLKANEALTYTLTISGSGNLMLIDNINIDFPSTFEVYDPKITSNIHRSNSGISGSRTFEWVLIPREQGKYEIPSAQFVYFNPQSKTFVTKTTENYTIDVAKGDGKVSSSPKNDVKILNSDIEYIKTGNPHLRPIGDQFFGSWLFWLLFLLPVLLTIIAFFVLRKFFEMRSDITSMRLRKATSLAKRRLRKAEKYLQQNDDENFYIEIYKAIWGYVSDKFSIPISQLSNDTVQETLNCRNVDQNIINKIMQTINDVDFARFAPGDSSHKRQNIYQQALQMILDLENQLKQPLKK